MPELRIHGADVFLPGPSEGDGPQQLPIDALDPPATNLVLGAQAGTNGVNALAILGTNVLSAPVWRVDGTTATNGIPIADLLCTNGVLRTPARFAIKWKNTTGLDPNADTDGDGLSDWDEVFCHGTDPNQADTDGDDLSDASEILTGTNPLDADENSDGIPDGVPGATWNDEHACPHRDGCPAKDSDSADCTCPVPVIRVTGDGTPLSERAELDFPTEAFCCCSRPGLFTYARLTHVDSNLSVWNAVMPTNWVDSHQCPDSATVLATDESGATPSRIDYQLVRRRYDDHGAVATNEVFGTGSLRVWATTLTLEPVTTVRTGGRIVNPCGIATNETAVFRMEVSPAAFPDDLIEWSAFPNGRIRFVDDDDTGREVSVLGLHPGDVTLTANVRGYAGPPPLVRARVMPRTTVPVYAWIVCGTNGVPSVEESELRGKFPEINRIWDQVGITWQLAEVNFVTNQAWMTILDDANRDTILSTICSYGNAPEGVELYCVESIAGNGGLTGRCGSIVVGQQSPAVFAHEFGHLCGLKDIYSSRPPKTDLIVSGAASRDRLEHDWPSEVEEGYYPIDFQQADIIGRLLMNGRSSTASVQTDISAGDVLGIWNHWRKDEETNIWGWHHDIDMVPIGFLLHGNKQPTVLP